jgi:hypothetical protein
MLGVWVCGLSTAGAAAADGPACAPHGNDPAFAEAARVLTRIDRADLKIRVRPVSPGCTAPESLKKVQVKTFAPDGTLADVRNVEDVPSPSGIADIALGPLEPRQLVGAEVLVQTGVPKRTYVLDASGEAAEFAVDAWSPPITPSIGGYGGQFNQHVYAKISAAVGVTPTNVLEMEQKVVALQPQLVRIFFNSSDFPPLPGKVNDRFDSFVSTVELAQRAGATIDITWQGGGFKDIKGTMATFGKVLLRLVQHDHITHLRWVTVQNEPNLPSNEFGKDQWEAMYRELDRDIADIRGQVHFMGGDLVRGNDLPDPTNQRTWFDYMALHMHDILDAWSIHAFWDYWDTDKLQARLAEVRAIWDTEPPDERKPLFVTEYGVRGIRTLNGVTADPGFWQDGTPITQTNVNAFQQAWFDVLSARLGYLGTIKWDSYFGKYDNGTQAYFMIGGPLNGWPLYPIYHVVHLWTQTVRPTWQVLGLDGESGTKLLTAYSSPSGGDLTLIGLDTAGAQLNVASPTQVSYSVGGLPPSTAFTLLLWNRDGNGQITAAGTIVSDAAGVATMSAPLQSVFALTTLPVQTG